MAITTRNVVGKMVPPDAGNQSEAGTIELYLSGRGTVDDAGTEQVVAGRLDAIVEADGDVKAVGGGTLALIPTDTITPSSLFYYAAIEIGDWKALQRWTIPSGGGDLDVGDIPLVDDVVDSLSYITITDEADLPTASAAYRQIVAYLVGGAGVGDAEYRCMKLADDTFDWIVRIGL